jgi:hypothetical protein
MRKDVECEWHKLGRSPPRGTGPLLAAVPSGKKRDFSLLLKRIRKFYKTQEENGGMCDLRASVAVRGFQNSLSGFASWLCHLAAMCPWENHFTSLCLSVLVWKVDISTALAF